LTDARSEMTETETAPSEIKTTAPETEVETVAPAKTDDSKPTETSTTPAPQTKARAKDNAMNMIGSFLNNLQKTLSDSHLMQEKTLMQYDTLTTSLNEHPYDKMMLPEPSVMESHMGSIPTIGTAVRLLYTELYFRHMHQHQNNVPLANRIASYQNYVALFKFFSEPAKMQRVIMLPPIWAWDLVSEFIYQFCDYATFWSKMSATQQTEILEKNPDARSAWCVPGVLETLYLIADPTKCHELGYYAYVGLCRVYCAVCDYTSVVALASKMDMQNRVYSSNPPCFVTLYHRVGFAYMMLRRYNDAVKTFVRILKFVSRMLRPNLRSQSVVTKKIDQICKLLMICRELAPQRIPDEIQNYLREHYADKNVQLQNGNISVFEDFFMCSCPRFVPGCIPAPRPAGAAETTATEQLQSIPRKQFQLFMRDASRQQNLSLMRSYLKLYTNISLAKLAEYVGRDPESVRRDIMCMNTSTHVLRDGVWVSNTDVDFFIENDMVHVSENKPARRFSDFFLHRLQTSNPV